MQALFAVGMKNDVLPKARLAAATGIALHSS